MFGIPFDGSDYERRCVSRGFLADNGKEVVFLFGRLHGVVFPLPRRFFLPLCGAHSEVYEHCDRPILRRILSEVTGRVAGMAPPYGNVSYVTAH